MFEEIKNKSVARLGIISFMVNCFPYAIYILLINRNGSLISDVLPMAIFTPLEEQRSSFFVIGEAWHFKGSQFFLVSLTIFNMCPHDNQPNNYEINC